MARHNLLMISAAALAFAIPATAMAHPAPIVPVSHRIGSYRQDRNGDWTEAGGTTTTGGAGTRRVHYGPVLYRPYEPVRQTRAFASAEGVANDLAVVIGENRIVTIPGVVEGFANVAFNINPNLGSSDGDVVVAATSGDNRGPIATVPLRDGHFAWTGAVAEATEGVVGTSPLTAATLTVEGQFAYHAAFTHDQWLGLLWQSGNHHVLLIATTLTSVNGTYTRNYAYNW
jgi:hypothetical protein